MKIEVLETYEALSRRAAALIASGLKRQPNLLLCASAGGTPTGAYQELAAKYTLSPRLFSRMRVLQIDEWLGLPSRHPATCRNDLKHKLLTPLGIARSRFIGFASDAPDPVRECRRVSTWLAEKGPIDICVLGLGTNGHIAMVEPSPELHPAVQVARLSPASRKHPLLQAVKAKPTHGLTLGMGDILRSRHILLLVSGLQKRTALAQLLKPRVTTRFPASLLWLHSHATLLCDRSAAGQELQSFVSP